MLVDNLQRRLNAREQDLQMLQELIDQRDKLLKGPSVGAAVPGHASSHSAIDLDLASEIDSYFSAGVSDAVGDGSAAANSGGEQAVAMSGSGATSRFSSSPVRARVDLRRVDSRPQVLTALGSHADLRSLVLTPQGACAGCQAYVVFSCFHVNPYQLIVGGTLGVEGRALTDE